ncbi:MAG: TraR/DksA family transcriptional regulator [Candidatus Omnitrophota bacterium]
MNKEELKKYREKLVTIKNTVQGNIKHIGKDSFGTSQKEASGDLSSYTLHMADMASDSYERDLAFDLVANEQELIYKIEESLMRIDEGTFGKCQSCGKKISKARLNIVPYAAFCVPCKQKEEKNKGK